ncbi:MAG: beta-ketoacyl-ACP synthase III [Actinomycetota bacterium]
MERFSTVAGTGSALPDRVVPNSYFEKTLDTSDEWIRDRTGISERHFVTEGQATSDLSADAAGSALDAAGIPAEQVDLLIVATLTPDRPLPATAVMVQEKLGMSCPAFDLNAACSGFSYGTSVADAMIRSGASDTVLVIGAEVLSRVLDMTDRSTCILFGDGAGAAVFTASQEPGVIGSILEADGSAAELLTIPAGGSERPVTSETHAARDHFVKMPNGREVYKRAVNGMTSACRELLEKSGYGPEDVDLLIPHQANARIMATVAKMLGIPAEKSAIDVESVGNTSAASIPIALDRAWRAGRISPEGLVLMTSFGAGLAWGANLIRWTASTPS